VQLILDEGRKSLRNPSREDAIWRAAIAASRGQPKVLPVIDYARGRRLGYVKGVDWWECPFDPGQVWWKAYCGFTSYDDLISEITAGKKYQTTWSKAHTTAPVANNWMDLWPVGGAPALGWGASRLTCWPTT